MLSFGQPEPQVDKFSNLHILYQDGPHSFNYTVVNPDGDITVRQTYSYTSTGRPQLRVDSDGILKVMGGTRRIAPSDLPAQKIIEDNVPAPRS